MTDIVTTHPVLLLRYPDGREIEVDATVSELLGAMQGIEYRQRYLTGCYRGMLEEAHTLMEQRNVKIPPQATAMLDSVNKECDAARKTCATLYAKFKDLLYWSGCKPWDESVKTKATKGKRL